MPATVPHAPGSVIEPAKPSLWRIFPPILLPIFLAVVDGTIVASALPAMAGAFGEVERVSWVVASYLVASTVAAPVYGRLGDAFGRRRLLLVALVLFVAASALCASARGIVSLTAARALQGFGGGGLMVLSQALLGENVPRRQLGRAQGILAAVIVVSSTFGPVAGGVLTQLFGWPSIFLINLPLGALAVLLTLYLPARPGDGSQGRFDWPGLMLFAGFVVPLLLALEQVQRINATTLFGVGVSLGVSLLCLMLLLRQERRAARPLFPLQMLAHPAMWRANAMAACSGALLVSEATLLPHPSPGSGGCVGRQNRFADAAVDINGGDGLAGNGLDGVAQRTARDLPLHRADNRGAWTGLGRLWNPARRRGAGAMGAAGDAGYGRGLSGLGHACRSSHGTIVGAACHAGRSGSLRAAVALGRVGGGRDHCGGHLLRTVRPG